MFKLNRLFSRMLLLACLINCGVAAAQSTAGDLRTALEKQLAIIATDAEISMVPEYCKEKLIGWANMGSPKTPKNPYMRSAQTRPSVSSQDFKKRMGKQYAGFHHYCMGLAALHHAELFSHSRGQQTRYLDRAMREFNYDFNSYPKNHFFYPTRVDSRMRATSLMYALGMDPENYEKKAPQTNTVLDRLVKETSQVYLDLANNYISVGDYTKALSILREGQKAVPESGAIARRLRLLKEHTANALRRGP